MTSPLVWQPSLLDGGPPAADLSFDRAVRDHLDATSWVDHVPGWLAGSDEVFALLVEQGEWSQRTLHLYEREVVEPRLTTGWASDRAPEPLPRIAAALSTRYGVDFDRIWGNLYRDGADSVAWHGDRNARVLRNPLVATLSLGARRRFQMRPRGGRIARTFELGHGDLLVMGGACQHDWQHCVPKTAKAVGPRISVTLRHSVGELRDPARQPDRSKQGYYW